MKKTLILLLAFFPLFSCSEPMPEPSAAGQQNAAVIYSWLQRTWEVNIHQMRGATGNKVYVHEDGHSEAVYDAQGKLVQDNVNDPSYNYYPTWDPLNHFSYDILPWLVWGNNENDPTSATERVQAYILDLEVGMKDVIAMPSPVNVTYASLSEPEKLAVEFFAELIEKSKSEAIYEYLKGNSANPPSLGQFQVALADKLKNDHYKIGSLFGNLPTPPQLRK